MASNFLPMLVSNIAAGITALIGIFNLFTLRESLMMIVMSSPISVWTWRVIDIALMIVIGIIWIIVVILSQTKFEKAFTQKTLSKVFSLVTGYQLLLFFIASMIVHILDAEVASFSSIVLSILQIVFSVILLSYSNNFSFMKKINLNF